MSGISLGEQGVQNAFADPLATPTPSRAHLSFMDHQSLSSVSCSGLPPSFSQSLSQTRLFSQMGGTDQSEQGPKKLPDGESLKFKLRRAKIEEMERQQALEDSANICITQTDLETLLDSFLTVKAEFSDLDGLSWHRATLPSSTSTPSFASSYRCSFGPRRRSLSAAERVERGRRAMLEAWNVKRRRMQLNHEQFTSARWNHHRSVHSVYADLQGVSGVHALPASHSLPSVSFAVSEARTGYNVTRPTPLPKRTQTAIGSERDCLPPVMTRVPSLHESREGELQAGINLYPHAPLFKNVSGERPEGNEEGMDALPPLMITRSLSRSLSNTFAPTPIRIPGRSHVPANEVEKDVLPLRINKIAAGPSRVVIQQTDDESQAQEEREVEALLTTPSGLGTSSGGGSFDIRPLCISPKHNGLFGSAASDRIDQSRIIFKNTARDSDSEPHSGLWSEREEDLERGEDGQEEIDIAELERVLDQLELDESEIADDLRERIVAGTNDDDEEDSDRLAECEFSRQYVEWDDFEHSDRTSVPPWIGAFATWGGPRVSYASTVGSTISRGKRGRPGLSMGLYDHESGNMASGIVNATACQTRTLPPLRPAVAITDSTLSRSQEPGSDELQGGRLKLPHPKQQPPIYLSKTSTMEITRPPHIPSPALSPRLCRAQKASGSRSPRTAHRAAFFTCTPESPELAAGESLTRPLHIRRHKALRPRQRVRRSSSFTAGAEVSGHGSSELAT